MIGRLLAALYPSAAGIPLWTMAVATFFRAHQITLPF